MKPVLTYRDAGVDIDAGNEFVERIKPLVARTRRDGVLTGIGGFGGLFEVPTGYREPVLVSGTDGVGTKLKLAIATGIHDKVGIDLVAMCVNDIVVTGAEPLFFQDYYATGNLDIERATAVVAGITEGCEAAGCALIGGETAELPGMYTDEDYDLAGFCVGVVEKGQIIDGSHVRAGDALIGLASSGPHSNGYSLIRKVLETTGTTTHAILDGRPLLEALMEPTRIYVKPLLELIGRVDVHAMAHITGGGIVENLPRVLPDGCEALIDTGTWPRPAVFEWLSETGGIPATELWRTFNCGVGMIIAVTESDVQSAIDTLNEQGESAWRLGDVQTGSRGVVLQ